MLVAAPDEDTAKHALWNYISWHDIAWKMGEPDEEYFEVVRADVIEAKFNEDRLEPGTYLLAKEKSNEEPRSTVRVAEG